MGIKPTTGNRMVLSKVENLAKRKEKRTIFEYKNSRFVGAIVLAEAESRQPYDTLTVSSLRYTLVVADRDLHLCC